MVASFMDGSHLGRIIEAPQERYVLLLPHRDDLAVVSEPVDSVTCDRFERLSRRGSLRLHQPDAPHLELVAGDANHAPAGDEQSHLARMLRIGGGTLFLLGTVEVFRGAA